MKLGVVFFSIFIFFEASQAQSKEITIAMGNFEPYYIEEGNTGIFTDIIKAAFRYIPKHQVKFIFGHSNKGLWDSFSAGRVDATTNVFDSIELEGCHSDPAFRFRDIAVSLKKSNLTIETIEDLKGSSVVSFQGARAFFGQRFTDSITNNYSEVAKPELQLRMLFAERASISVGDLYIFLQSMSKTGEAAVSASEFQFHDIFPQIYSRMVFRDKQLCEQFNSGLAQVIASGEYETIYQSYARKLGGID